MLPSPALLVPRAGESASAPSYSSGSSGGTNEFVTLLASPFDSELNSSSFLSSLIFSLALTVLLTIAFSLIRPYHNVVYAPRAKYADRKHAPPVIAGGLFGWATTIMRIREAELVDKVGLDAALFMRFVRMMRNIFSILTVLGCGMLIPTNLLAGSPNTPTGIKFLIRLTPQFVWGSSLWVYVVVAYVFDAVILFFLWRNYGAVLRLRRQYFESTEYQRSLHSRTLLLMEIPAPLRSDEGIVKITEEVRATNDVPRAAIARNVKDLPELVEEHDKSVRELEKHLAKYLKDPNKLPAKRPTCKASSNDKAYSKGQEVDAIDYLTSRIKELEVEIRQVRESVDKRNAMAYGFASYERIAEAHKVAYVARRKGPQGTIVRMAPKPNDLIWKNLPMTKKERDWQNFINNLWVTLLTLVWIAPNVLIAIFLTNLSHLGLVWPAFQRSLEAHSALWSLVQGILAPALTTAVFFFLPKLFRALVTKAGDVTRTSRERHVMHKLFSFFVFNNLVVFSLFSAAWAYVTVIINASKTDEGVWQAIKSGHPTRQITTTLINVSPYWTFWLLQRNLGSAIDLSQLVTLVWGSIQRRFLSPTPRELIELSAPQPFDYASYYNYFLFYAAVSLCFGCLQPLILPITALYFWMDTFSKKYLVLYIFITKYESGGMFWRSLYNRMLVCTALGNIVIALLIVAKDLDWAMLGVMAPLPFVLVGFKIYCMRNFDDAIHYYHQGTIMADAERAPAGEQKRRKGDRVGVRFGNPLLYKPLITPMVSAKSQHLLGQVYSGRLSLDDTGTVAGFSDVYMDAMDANRPGKPSNTGPFEFVAENQLDFEHWKHDSNFAHEAGGDGELYGHASDTVRPGTPSSMTTATRTATWESGYSSRNPSEPTSQTHSRVQSRDSDGNDTVEFFQYPKGYHATPSSALREHSPGPDSSFSSRPQRRPVGPDRRRDDSRDGLVSHAADMPRSPPPPQIPTPGGYGMIRLTPGESPEDAAFASTPGGGGGEEETSYDYFRRGRVR